MEPEQNDRERLLRKYIELKRQAGAIEEEIESLKSAVFVAVSDMMSETGEKEIAFEDALFTVSYRKTFDYPADIKKKEDELKTAKKEAEVSGAARLKSETGFVVLKKNNNQ